MDMVIRATKRWRDWAAGIGMLVLLAMVGAVLGRQAGEVGRTSTIVARAETRIQKQVLADCTFLKAVAALPTLSVKPTPVLLGLAESAREGYINKNCVVMYGPVPEVPKDR